MEDVQLSMLKKWDRTLVNAWARNPSVYSVGMNFLEESGVSFFSKQDKHSTAVLVEKFAELGIFARSPKTHHQFSMNVKDFFKIFFQDAHTLLLQNKKEEAREALDWCKVREAQLVLNKENEFVSLPRTSPPQQIPAE
ncbi:hypothetical protein AUJ77_02790 [Candidatus Nomurabacteria bacterium CG1_02_43_90]|uniref:Uncharacterized protein n=1 Tax=Candidatus Nomurabacteria bacterium CG1_02_43_90 TaxID=1805281 RepID=A0A1J4V827_9BACT|nr:MAG: hypothetical protein AUJ77_02790 [Candidatus Nomurabacteria bacterium CG1_02_43_90]